MKLRLNASNRYDLKILSKRKIQERNVPDKKLVNAFTKLVTLSIAAYNKDYTDKDKKVLRKHGLLEKSCYLYFSAEDSKSVATFFVDLSFMDYTKNKLEVVSSRIKRTIVKYNGPEHRAYKAYLSLKTEYERKLYDIQTDYLKLINSAKTLEDLTEIWPEAEEIKNVFSKNEKLSNSKAAERVKRDYEKSVNKSVSKKVNKKKQTKKTNKKNIVKGKR